MMGVLADRTSTRWGKFRPWVLWTAAPWAIAMVLAYTNPGLGMTGNLVWACLTNVLLMTLYSANNTPYSAMSGVMTGDVNERTSLSSFRFVAAMIAQLIVGGFTLPLVAKFGQGNNAKGWQMTMGLWALVCLVLFAITFAYHRERIPPDPKQKSDPKRISERCSRTGHGSRCLFSRWPTSRCWRCAVARCSTTSNTSWTKTSCSTCCRGSAATALTATTSLNAFGLIVDANRSNVASVGFSLANMSSQFVTVLGVFCSPALSRRFGKRAVAIAGFSITTVFMAAFVLLPAQSIGTIFIMEYLRALAYAPTIPLIWAMFADVADYSEWKTGRRTTGVIFATILFGLKTGLSLGGFAAGWLLSGYGYVPNAVQTPEALQGIRMTISIYPSILFGIVIVCLLCYKIGKRFNLQIQDELAERRSKFAAAV